MEVSLTNEVILIVPTPIACSIFPTIPLIGQLFGGISHRLEKYESSPHKWRVAPESSTIQISIRKAAYRKERKVGFRTSIVVVVRTYGWCRLFLSLLRNPMSTFKFVVARFATVGTLYYFAWSTWTSTSPRILRMNGVLWIPVAWSALLSRSVVEGREACSSIRRSSIRLCSETILAMLSHEDARNPNHATTWGSATSNIMFGTNTNNRRLHMMVVIKSYSV